MAKQPDLPGIPSATKRKIIDAIETACLERDKLSGKRTRISDDIAIKSDKIQELLVEHKLDLYTFEDDNGVLQDVFRENTLKKRKSKLNPKKSKKGDE
jgi:hypothetical protein